MLKLLVIVAIASAMTGCATASSAPRGTPSDGTSSTPATESPIPSASPAVTGVITIIPNAVADGPGTSIADAIAAAPSDEQLVNGWLLIDAGGDTWLCEDLSDSQPPECTGARLKVEGFPTELPADVRVANGVQWLPAVTQLFGDITAI